MSITIRSCDGDRQLINTSSPLLEQFGLAMGDSVNTPRGRATVLGVCERGHLWVQLKNENIAGCYGLRGVKTLAEKGIVKLDNRIQTSVTFITRGGKDQLIYTSIPILKNLGLAMGDRVRTPRGHATVLGVCKQGHLWVQCNKEKGASCYEGIQDAEALAKKGIFKLDTPLVNAICKKDFDLAKTLLENGASPHGVSSDNGNTCLHWAVKHGNHEMVSLLLKKGGKYQLNIKNNCKEIPVKLAVTEKRWECLDILVSKEVNGESSVQLNKALTCAVEKDELTIAKQLLEKGANSQNGCLRFAIINNNPQMVKLLVDHGKNKNNETPHRLALRMMRWECARELETPYFFAIDRDKNTLKKPTSNKKEREIAFNNLKKLADQGVVAAKQVVADIYRREQAPGFWCYLFYGQQRRAKNLYADLAQLTTNQQVESALIMTKDDLWTKLIKAFRYVEAADAYHSGAAMKFIEQHAKNKESLVYYEANAFFGIIWNDKSADNIALKSNPDITTTVLKTVSEIRQAVQRDQEAKDKSAPHPQVPPLDGYQQILQHIGEYGSLGNGVAMTEMPMLPTPAETLQKTLQNVRATIDAIEKEKAKYVSVVAEYNLVEYNLAVYNTVATHSEINAGFLEQARRRAVEQSSYLARAIDNFKTQQLVAAKEVLSSVQNATQGTGGASLAEEFLAEELNALIDTALQQITQWNPIFITTEIAPEQTIQQANDAKTLKM